MTTETPFTVPDLRAWATSLRGEADRNAALKYPTPYGVSMITVYRAQAAAFDALADGIEACDEDHKHHCRINADDAFWIASEAEHIGRILRGEKPK